MLKNTGRIFLIAAFIGLVCLIASPAIAAPLPGDRGLQSLPTGDAGGRMSGLLGHLKEQGFDLSAIQAAVTSGDLDAARSLLDQFMEEHKYELPAPAAREIGAGESGVPDTLEELPARPSGDRGVRLLGLLDQLEEQGFDMSEIRAAVAGGDLDTARTLMRQFMEEHKDELPAPPGHRRPETEQRNNLKGTPGPPASTNHL
jgi:DNA-binding transcriptional MerR regulator